MIIVRIEARLGNQMFQYAYAKSLQHLGYSVKIYKDESYNKGRKNFGQYYLDHYKIDIPRATKRERNQLFNPTFYKILKNFNFYKRKNKIIAEKSLLFDKKLMHPPDNTYIIGFFQSENYFKKIKPIILKNFSLKRDLSSYAKEINQQIRKSISSCSLHIRRGDYLKPESPHNVCTVDYFSKAASIIKNKNKDTQFFIFSDDMDWVKRNVKIAKAIFVEANYERIPNEDIFLMSQCDHNIIANSSFSWWGAYLNDNSNKIVIAPKKWYATEEWEGQAKDVVCRDWMRI